uniref:NADH-ubiquinone oxidoreductase chain 4L n=1 Tax=Ceutorhynchus obstrictus TaxID=307131 RepID=J9PGR0_9CUCU|nr:NADH dehydrogenase subunit 4L [Ceutorhynchus obstrictus]AEP27577.1 NADH dehydrogenase subunit 4L [Ceutorhynchus obstrictus]QEV84354.1 NADH dehydrogenase subunit 4L [Ceutorhynchus obstrictus]
MYFIPFIMLFFSSLLVYVLKYKHFLLMLLSLESMVLSLFMLLFIYLSSYLNEFLMVMFYLSMSVCESALGLSLLVLIIRTYGNDKILMFDNLW